MVVISPVRRPGNQKPTRRPSVAANFNVIVSLINKGDARRLRALLLSAPTLRASLKGTREPALHVAIARSQLLCAEVLLEMGSSANAPADNGRTALHVAVSPPRFPHSQSQLGYLTDLDVRAPGGKRVP